VTLLSEVETVTSYTSRDDAFFYALVFDPHQKTLLADRGNIRIGGEFQAAVPAVTNKSGREEALEELVWRPDSGLEDDKVDQFIIISRSVGTFARALDCSSSVKQPSLHMSAAAASRDITVMHAYQALHGHDYNIGKALASLVPATGPVLCRDEMEDWSSAEANLFEEAIEKYGKDFNGIKKDFLPWKSMRNIIEYFFMWKTTDRYVQQKRVKALEAESKLKQVYVPAYTRKTTRVTGPSGEVMVLGKDCETYTETPKYSWSQYKKYGRMVDAGTGNAEDCFVVDKTFNSAARLAQLRPGLIIEPGSPSKGGKTRAAFFLLTTPLTRAARRVTAARLNHYARRPTKLIDMKAMRAEVVPRLSSAAHVTALNQFCKRARAPLAEMCVRMGQSDSKKQEWLVLKNTNLAPAVEAWPRPAKRPDGSYIYERLPCSGGDGPAPGRHQMLYKKRPYEEKPVEPPPTKSRAGGKAGGTQHRSYSVNQVAPKGTSK
jgi:metastasis-associated protein MTA